MHIPHRRQLLLAMAAAAASPWAGADDATGQARALLRPADGLVLLMRHASAPGGGDPVGFRLEDCATQRNLSDEGRDQARRIGQRLRELALPVAAVWHSQWCRTRDTAVLMDVAAPQPEPLFNSFFNDPSREQRFAAEARARLGRWAGPGVLLVVTHQVNITALTGIFPSSGEIVVARFAGASTPQVLGRLSL